VATEHCQAGCTAAAVTHRPGGLAGPGGEPPAPPAPRLSRAAGAAIIIMIG
jgi:hypothetical protein